MLAKLWNWLVPIYPEYLSDIHGSYVWWGRNGTFHINHYIDMESSHMYPNNERVILRGWSGETPIIEVRKPDAS